MIGDVTEQHWRDLTDLVQRRLTREEFLAKYPALLNDTQAVLRGGLAAAEQHQNSDQLEYYLSVGGLFGLEPVATTVLTRLLGQDWHHSHETIVQFLQRRRDPSSVPALIRAISHVPPYLEWDENRALAVKALHALEDIGTPDAKTALRSLIADPDPVVSSTAARMVQRDRPPKPPAPTSVDAQAERNG